MLRPATAHQLQSNRPEPDLQGRRDHVHCSAYKNGVDANQRMISDHTKMTDNRILDDKTGRLIRYATLSLLYLVQVRTDFLKKCHKNLTCCRVLLMDFKLLASLSCSDRLASPSLASPS